MTPSSSPGTDRSLDSEKKAAEQEAREMHNQADLGRCGLADHCPCSVLQVEQRGPVALETGWSYSRVRPFFTDGRWFIL